MIEVIKTGKTYIKDKDITFSQFKEKYNMPNYKIEWEVKEDELGYTLTDEDNHFWWVDYNFFNKNYKIKGK